VVEVVERVDLVADHRVAPSADHGHRVDVFVALEARVAARFDFEITDLELRGFAFGA